MPRQLDWSDLRVGIISAAAIAVLVAATLLFARVGGLHGKKVILYMVTDDAGGVLDGTEVWLSGQKAGLVTNVSFRAPSTDTSERLLVTMDFLKEALPNARRDSYAQIRAGRSLIGAPVVYISAGSATSPPLHDRDTLHTRVKTAITDLVSQVGSVRPAFSALLGEVKELSSKTTRPVGTVGNFRTSGLTQMPEFSAGMSRITDKATTGNGTIGLAMRRNLMGRAARVMAASDSIRALMASNKGSLGRFRRDTTLVTKAKGVMAELDTLRALASDPVGSIGGAHSDSTLVRELARSRILLDSLISNIKSHPLRYINF